MNFDYNSQFPIWAEFLSSLKTKAPHISYPKRTESTVLMGGVCGLGHRLVRNAKIFHHARSLGFNTNVFWFPFQELFYDNEYISYVEDDLSEKNRFTNEPGDIQQKSGEIIPFRDINLSPYFDFCTDRNSKTQSLIRYKNGCLMKLLLKRWPTFTFC